MDRKNTNFTVYLLVLLVIGLGGLFFYANQDKFTLGTADQGIQRESSAVDQPVYLIDAYVDGGKNYIEVDRVEWLSGEASITAQVEDGQCQSVEDCYDYPNGYKRNLDPSTETFEVSDSALVVVNGTIAWKVNELDETNLGDPFGLDLSISFEKFEEAVSDINPYPFDGPPFKPAKTFITIDIDEGGLVTKIFEPYQE
jgi:hypothetical protein